MASTGISPSSVLTPTFSSPISSTFPWRPMATSKTSASTTSSFPRSSLTRMRTPDLVTSMSSAVGREVGKTSMPWRLNSLIRTVAASSSSAGTTRPTRLTFEP